MKSVSRAVVPLCLVLLAAACSNGDVSGGAASGSPTVASGSSGSSGDRGTSGDPGGAGGAGMVKLTLKAK